MIDNRIFPSCHPGEGRDLLSHAQENRLSCALKFANELSDSRLRKNKERIAEYWTKARRELQALQIYHHQPWLFSTGPRSAASKQISSQNAFKHGGRCAATKKLCAMMRAQNSCLRFLRLVRRKNWPAHPLMLQQRMMKLEALLQSMRKNLEEAGIETPALDVRAIVKSRLNLSDADLIAQSDLEISSEDQKQIEADIKDRLAGKPVSKILGVKEFWGLDFRVTEDTLSPRPETEILVQAALDFLTDKGAPLDILDLGTGTGCIPIALLKELPNARAVAVDLSEEALKVAVENAAAHGVAERIAFVQSDWFENIPTGMSFDIITSNPPYIANPDIESLPKEVKNHDPILALDGGEDGIGPYKIIFGQLIHRLKESGRAFFEYGQGQSESLTRLVDDSHATLERVVPDYAGIERVMEISCGDKRKKNEKGR